MPSPTDDRVAYLEARLAELEQRAVRRPRLSLPRWSLARRLTLTVLALMLALPAGVVLASHRFSDVPTNHRFHADIGAIADAGITTGCATNRYCPDGLVTRGQMAAFLNRLGALQAGSAPKVNADRVDGRHANQLVRVTRIAATFNAGLPANGLGIPNSPAAATLANFRIQAPAAGFVTVNLSMLVFGGNQASVLARLVLRQGTTDQFSPGRGHTFWPPTGDDATVPLDWVFPVTGGEAEVFIEVWRTNAGATATVTNVMGTAIYTPYGWNGGSALTP